MAAHADFDSVSIGSNPISPASIIGLNALMVGQQAVTLWLRHSRFDSYSTHQVFRSLVKWIITGGLRTTQVGVRFSQDRPY
jgi:hypothetical protein